MTERGSWFGPLDDPIDERRVAAARRALDDRMGYLRSNGAYGTWGGGTRRSRRRRSSSRVLALRTLRSRLRQRRD